MKAIKVYLAANDSDGAHIYKDMPQYDHELDRWVAKNYDPYGILGFLNRSAIEAIGIDPVIPMEVPIEVCMVFNYDAE